MDVLWLIQIPLDTDTSRTTNLSVVKFFKEWGNNLKLVVGTETGKRDDFGFPGYIKYFSMPRIPLISSLIFQTKLFFFLTFYVIFKKPDIIVSDYTCVPSTFLLAFFRRLNLLKTKFVMDLRNTPMDIVGPKAFLSNFKFNLSIKYAKYTYDGFTVITPVMREEICQQLNINRKNVAIWTSGVSLSFFDEMRYAENNVRRSLNLSGEFIVIYHGGFAKARGLQNAVQAMEIVKKNYGNIILLLLGEGPSEGELKSLVQKNQLEDCVLIHPTVDFNKIPVYINVADVAMMPYPNVRWLNNSSPIKLMEYLAMGKPVIVTDLQAFKDVIGVNKCGIYIKDNSPEEIAKGILFAYEHRDELKGWGEIGRKIVEKEYTWEIQIKHFEGYLKNIDKINLRNN